MCSRSARTARGISATAGHGDSSELSGQGAAFRVVGKTRVAVFTVVNAYGGIVDRAGRVVRGNRDVQGRRQNAAEIVTATGVYYPPAEPRSRNTTLTLVVTDQRLDPLQLRSIARQVHASMARAIQPFHSRWDGDILYACSTRSVDDAVLDEVSLGVVASELAWDAVLACYDE